MKKIISLITVLSMVLLITGSALAITPVIKANDQTGTVSILPGQAFSINISLAAEAGTGQSSDWWLVYTDGSTWSYYNLSGSWQSGLIVTYQGPLSDLSSYSVNVPGLSSGSYTFYFAVDTVPNGTVDYGQGVLFYDGVVVNVTSGSLLSFFVTSTGNGSAGGDLGGLAGADAKCQSLATAAGVGGRTWRAYLSTDNPLVNARDRIGTGPWFNQQGIMVASNLTTLHNGVAGSLILTELGQVVPTAPLDHDILTGSTADGNVMTNKTCSNWTDSTDASGGQVGHADIAVGDLDSESWNSQHDPQCSEAALNSTAGTGRIYCFAID